MEISDLIIVGTLWLLFGGLVCLGIAAFLYDESPSYKKSPHRWNYDEPGDD